MSVTINDVAKKAGVSHTTVSWVIHNDPRITQKTKDKVNIAIEELNYHPNYNARSLVKGKTDAIAVVAGFFSSYFELSVLRGIESAMSASSENFNLNLYTAFQKENDVLTEILYGHRADAVILLCDSPSQRLINAYKEKNIPLLLIENYHDELLSVKSNNIKGAEVATDYLLDSGYKKIGIVVEELNGEHIPGLSQVERMLGFENSFKKKGLDLNKNLIFEMNTFNIDTGKKLAQNIVDNDIDIDAIFCAAGDIIALGIIDQFKKLGKEIPKDYAIVGFDDIDISSLVSPSLTTIKQNLNGLGDTAYNMAVKAVTKRDILNKHEVLDVSLVKRESA